MVDLLCSLPSRAGSDCHGHGECLPVFSNATNVSSALHDIVSNATGESLTRYYCNCSRGWTGKSDWFNYDDYGGGDCHLNQYALYVLWAINLTLMLNSTRYSVTLLTKRIVSRKRKRAGRKKSPWHKDDTLVFAICGSTAQLFLSFLGLFKLIFGQDQLVGRDWPVTLVYIVGRGFFYFAVNSSQFS